MISIRHRNPIRAAAIVVAITGACADPVSSPRTLDVASQASLASQPDSLLGFSGLERAFLQLERDIPGFAGLYREQNKLVALSTLNTDEAFRSALAGELTSGKHSAAIRSSRAELDETRVVKAKYRFRDLAVWRAAIRTNVMALPGVASLDLDEKRNQLVIGVQQEMNKARVLEYLNEVRVPVDAVLLRVEAEPQITQSLDSRIRPLTGGTRHGRYSNYFGPPDWNPRWTAGNWCTLGMSAIQQGAQRLLLVSHCTSLEGAKENPAINYNTYVIGQDWYQAINGQTGWSPPAPFGYNPFGAEQFDRAGPTCGPVYDLRPCRHAEIAVWSLDNIEVFFNEVAFTLGRIARPAFSVPGVNPAGFTIALNASQPYFTVAGEVVDPMHGDQVQKVGLATGWTYGAVYSTCTDFNYTSRGVQRRVWCHDRADLGAQPGDSGSPVFRIFDPGAGTVLFYGLVSFNGTDQPGSTAFASVRQIRAEIGLFQVF